MKFYTDHIKRISATKAKIELASMYFLFVLSFKPNDVEEVVVKTSKRAYSIVKSNVLVSFLMV